MKIILIIWALGLSLLSADEAVVIIDEANQTKVMETKLQKVLDDVQTYKENKNKKMETELIKILKNVKAYKANNLLERKRLLNELTEVKRELARTKRQLRNVKQQLYEQEMEVNEVLLIEDAVPVDELTIHRVIEPNKKLPVTPWVEVTVENDVNIYDLALKYYGDSQEYKKIYAANQHLIRQDYQIRNGMSLIIPMTGTFEEQAMLLNSN